MSFGTVKMYDENRGGASTLIPAQTVEFESVFDRDRGKYRAADVRVI